MRNTLFNAGAGSIGNYDACSYNLHGEGTFRANAGCNPFCGEIGELHVEKEVRIEMILPAFKKTAVTRALLSVHPYEEPAFEFLFVIKHMGTGRFRCSGRSYPVIGIS